MKTLHYSTSNLEQSKGIPLVLLHGFLESSIMWDHVKFPDDTPVIRIDLPGHGKSNDSELMCDSIQEMAKSVIDVINELQMTKYHIIGHSIGGYVALELKKMDARADKVMLLNSNFWADSPQKVKDRLRVAEIVPTNKAHFVYEVIPNLFLNPQQFDTAVRELISEALEISSESIAKASIAMSKRSDFTDFVLENPLDFTIIQGIEDTIVPSRKMRRALKDSGVNYLELENVGHMAHFEASPTLNSAIESFLN